MLGFVFPGQGSQAVGMGRALAQRYPIAREVFAEADAVLGEHLSRLCFEGPEDRLRLTANAQPALVAASVAALRVVQAQTGLSPVVVAGHSLGEYTALVCAEALSFADALRLVRQRGQFMQDAVPVGEGAMAACLGLEPAAVQALCGSLAQGRVLSVANFNTPTQTVVSGHADAVGRAVAAVEQQGGKATRLKVSAPFHCALMEPAARRMAVALGQAPFSTARVPVVTNTEGAPVSEGPLLRDALARQVTAPVQWLPSMRRMVALGVRTLIEVGPGRVLGDLMRWIDPGVRVLLAGEPEHLDELGAVARADLRDFVGPVGNWRLGEGGGAVSAAGDRVLWPDGTSEAVTAERWQLQQNGVRLRRRGRPSVLWQDGRLSLLDPQGWAPRPDGGFRRLDGSAALSSEGRLEHFPADAWEQSPDGALRKRDGTRIVWPDGLEWTRSG